MPIVPAITNNSAPNGGNSLGLNPSDGVLVVCLVSLSWVSATDSYFLTSMADQLFSHIDEMAKAKDLYLPFKYLNYAAGNQDPIAGYGDDVKERLQRASKQYDPKGLFQNAVPGGFKLFA